MARVPLYERRVEDGIKTEPTKIATGGIKNMEQLSRLSGAMAGKLQDVSEKLYLTDFESTARTMADDIVARNKADPEAMKTEFEAAYTGLSKGASPFMEAELKARFDMMSRPFIAHAADLKTRIETDKLKESSLTVLKQATNMLEHNSAQMLNSNVPVAFDASRSAQLQLLTIDEMLSKTDANGLPLFDAGFRANFREEATQNIMSLGLKGWFDEQGNKSQAMQEVLSGQKKFKFYDAGGKVQREINPLEELDVRTFDKLKGYMERAVDAQQFQAERQRSVAQVQSYINEDLIIDPKDKKQNAAIDAHFQSQFMPSLEGASEAEKASAITDYISKFGVVPNSLKGNMRATLRNGIPEQQIFTADLIARISEKTPMALDDFPEKDISYGLMLAGSLRNGLSPAEAFNRVNLEFDPLKEDIVKKRREEIKKEKNNYATKAQEAIRREGFLWGTRSTPLPEFKDLSDAAVTDYKNIYETEYIRTGDKEVAKESANQIFQRTYGATEVTGKARVIKYPPEKFYQVPGIPNDWMQEQLLEEVKTIGQYKDIKHSDIALVPDSITAREAVPGGQPSYLVFVKGKDGAYEPVRHKDGGINRFKFDPKGAIEKTNARYEEEKKKKIKFEKGFKDITKFERELIAAEGIPLPAGSLGAEF